RQQVIQALRQAGALFRIDLRVSVVRIAVGISIDVRIAVDIRITVHVGISINIRGAVNVGKDSAIAAPSISSGASTIRITWNVAAAIAEYSRAGAANIWRKLRTKDAIR